MSLMGLCAIQAGVMVAGLDTGSLRLGGAQGIHGFAGCTQDIARLVAVAYGVSSPAFSRDLRVCLLSTCSMAARQNAQASDVVSST